MFIGHYAPALALQGVRKSPSLMAGFIAVQLVDIGFFSLNLLGIEKWRLNPAITGLMPVDLYYMPFTHSLLGAAIWALIAGCIATALADRGRKLIAGITIGALVLSHWVLDLLVHHHDLGLLGDQPPKLGLALWDQPWIEMPLEIALVLAAMVAYKSITQANTPKGDLPLWSLLLVMFVSQSINWFAPTPPTVLAFSGLALFSYGAFIALAWWLDQTRERRTH